ncbi:MAG: hypothetical protein LBO05_13925 [Deltaproteobacteria bacterium]|jgi:hypothetical protein|nr:hypothetical protein [Deltaproteobacteria bacterium]
MKCRIKHFICRGKGGGQHYEPFLDHTFEEDKRGVTKKGGAEVLSILRKPSPNILRIAQIEARESFSFTVKKIQADSHYLAEIDSVIGNIFGDA